MTASNEHEKEDPRQGHNGQTEQECLLQANLGDQRTILLIAGIDQFSITIWNPITAGRLEYTLFAIFTRPSMRVLSFWEQSVTLTFAEVKSHVFAVLTQGLSLGATGITQVYTTVIVASEERFE